MNNIKKARKEKGLTQKELAEKVGVTQGNLSSWETDRWKPDLDALKKLCEVLNCSADYLLGQEKPDSSGLSPRKTSFPVSRLLFPQALSASIPFLSLLF